MSEATTARIRLILEEDDVGRAQDAAFDSKVDLQVEPQAQFIDPITACIVAGSVAVVGTFLVNVWERARGGLIIDLSAAGGDRVTRTRKVPLGVILIIAADGKGVKIEAADLPKDNIAQLLDTLVKKAFSTATDIATVASQVLADESKVHEVDPGAAA